MILVCDIGNTRIKSGIFNGKELTEYNSFSSFDEFKASAEKYEFSGCIYSSVVPATAERLNGFIISTTGAPPRMLTNKTGFNLKIEYKTPATLGIDRICSAEGAVYLFNKSGRTLGKSDVIVSVDFGTATTLNVVRYPDIFAGGLILPGVQLMFDSLSKNTAQLPGVSEEDFSGPVGSDTKSSIAAGVIAAQTGMIEKTVMEIKREFDAGNIHVYVTGGNAEKIIPHLDLKFEFVRELVLLGIIAVDGEKI